MQMVFAGLIVAGLIPLITTYQANRHTSLAHALCWTIAAWLSWGVALLIGDPFQRGMEPGRYCALCMIGCAGVAVLGARRPHVGAWNFVVLGLLSIMVLPLLESQFIGTHPVDGLRIFFMSATIAVVILNYLPTRFAPAACLMLAACGAEILLLYAPDWFPGQKEAVWVHALLLLVPWIGWLCLIKRQDDASEADRIWLRFRDSWGLLWAQRVREQFNQAAVNASWPVKLTWRGIVRSMDGPSLTPEQQVEIVETLRAVLQRFLESTKAG